MPTRCGSALTATEPAPADATVVGRLRSAGAAIIGKTHCTEWALNDPAPTRNPWDDSRTPGGSSAGSAVAVAAGMCRATVDTQTAGDVLRPAAYNSVVGFKPTAGWAPLDGVIPVAPTIDTIGITASCGPRSISGTFTPPTGSSPSPNAPGTTVAAIARAAGVTGSGRGS